MNKKYCIGCPHLKEVTDKGAGYRKFYRKYCLLSKPHEIYKVKICPLTE